MRPQIQTLPAQSGFFGIACLFAALIGSLSVSAPAMSDDVVQTTGAQLRFMAGPVKDGVAQLGLAIDLKPGWHTYWRYPGDSGVPPDITSEATENVATFTIDYPAPIRFGDASDQTIGYQGRVVFLINARLADPTKLAHLTINARLGICRDICVPVDESLTASIDPAAAPDQAATIELSAAAGLVPQPTPAGSDLSITGIKRDASVKPEMITFSVKGPSGQLNDVFVEGPEGWALPLPARVSGSGDESTWSFALDGLPSGAQPKGTKLTFTIVGKAKATTQSLILQ